MNVSYVDTDVIVRFISGDDPVKMRAATTLFTAVEEGKQTLSCPVTVIADAVYVLTSRHLYALDRGLVASALSALVSLPRFRVAQRPIVQRALDLFAGTRLDFGDAMIVATMEHAGVATLYSYDGDFDRFSTIQRQEP
ncbi:MAG: PIN domain-containing protein [Chloroflexota bacterium]